MLEWVRGAHRAGTRIVSSCTGSLALAEAGLLDGLEATTHWAFVDAMRAEYPKVKVRADRIIVAADKAARIVSAGGATSWTDLVLYLVGRHVNEEEARRLAKMSLFDWRHNGQNPYARLIIRQSTDAAIGKAQAWAAENYCEQDIVTAMAEHAKLPLKTFTRRFKAATGYAPLDYVQRLRIEEGKQMLEISAAAVESIAEDVGYADAASFRRCSSAWSANRPPNTAAAKSLRIS